ncbi:MAG: recombinase family protein [Chloroflexi bacterium]|nr:recombinase family protein [Chloroflexota bacterium]
MNAVIYTRVAAASELRLLRFLTYCRRYAQQEGLAVVGEFRDIGSGMTLDRPDLTAMRRVIAQDSIDVVIVYVLSQLTRSSWHCEALRREFALRGAKLHLVSRRQVI